MFNAREIQALGKLIDPHVGAGDVLLKEEGEAVGKRTNLNRIRDQLIVPQHQRDKKTITLIKVITNDFDFTGFVSNITNCLRPTYELRLGASFIMTDGTTPSYVYAIPAKPINKDYRHVHDDEDEEKLIRFTKTYSQSDLLDYVFHQSSVNNPFAKSGLRPEKLVCATAWITKVKYPYS